MKPGFYWVRQYSPTSQWEVAYLDDEDRWWTTGWDIAVQVAVVGPKVEPPEDNEVLSALD